MNSLNTKLIPLPGLVVLIQISPSPGEDGVLKCLAQVTVSPVDNVESLSSSSHESGDPALPIKYSSDRLPDWFAWITTKKAPTVTVVLGVYDAPPASSVVALSLTSITGVCATQRPVVLLYLWIP